MAMGQLRSTHIDELNIRASLQSLAQYQMLNITASLQCSAQYQILNIRAGLHEASREASQVNK
jgi:hypothetical protein